MGNLAYVTPHWTPQSNTPRFLDTLWESWPSLRPLPKLQKINCCQLAIWHSCVVRIIVPIPFFPAASAKGVASVPCQALSRTSQPSSALSQENATNWNLIVDAVLAVICWGDFLLEWQSHLLHSSKAAACTLVPSVSRVFQWLYSASVSSGPLSNSFFNPGSSLQTDTTRVVLKLYPK